MKTFSFYLIALLTLGSADLVAVQDIGVSGPLTSEGQLNGVLFTAGGVTLDVGGNPGIQNVNTNNNTAGIVTSDASDNITFSITSGTSVVNGTVGVGGGGAINVMTGAAGTSTIIFNGPVITSTTNIGSGTMQFNNSAVASPLTFTADGTLIISGDQIFTGAVDAGAANTGTLTLGSASQLNGGVGGTAALNQVNVLQGSAGISGTLQATNFSLNTNTLSLVGALTLPVNAAINTTINSNAVFGKVNAGTHNDSIAAPVVTVNASVPAGALLTPGAPIFVVSAGAGSSGVPVLVTSNNPRYTFTGLNLNGNIEIFPTLIPSAAIVTNPIAGVVGSVMDSLVGIAAANPGTDLAFVVSELLTLTPDALENALLQISPASGLVGVAREGFNTTRQFQRVWLEHLQRNRYYCLVDDCCNPAGEIYAGPRVWADGFGYYGHQDDKAPLNGYKANTWGGVLAYELPVMCGLRVGLGGGFAYTDLDEHLFGNKTDIHNYQATFYFTYDTNPWFVDGGFSLGWNRYDGTRHIRYADVNRTASAKYNGREYTAFVATGYQYDYSCFEITPLATLLYSHLNIDDYTETGALSLDQHVGEQRYNFWESGLGMKLAYLYQTNCGLFIPEVHSLWLYDYNDKGLFGNSGFTGLGAAAGTYPIRGPELDRNIWNIGGSLTYWLNCNISVQVFYDYERSKSYFDHQGMLELAYDF